jgi:hypothetical protein
MATRSYLGTRRFVLGQQVPLPPKDSNRGLLKEEVVEYCGVSVNASICQVRTPNCRAKVTSRLDHCDREP